MRVSPEKIGQLAAQADRANALLFSEPQIVIAWQPGTDRPDIFAAVGTGLFYQADGTPTPVTMAQILSWIGPFPWNVIASASKGLVIYPQDADSALIQRALKYFKADISTLLSVDGTVFTVDFEPIYIG